MERELKERLFVLGYEVSGQIGAGAFAKVYQVRRSADQEELACKMAKGQQAVDILRREAELLKRIEHPLFPEYRGFAEEGTYAFLFMEKVEGKDLVRLLQEKGALGQQQAARIAAELAEGLRYLHGCPGTILYRDLKPENVRVMSNGRARLLDLGCACKADDACRTRAGTRYYAAPEQLGEAEMPCGTYSDVYALGRLLHYMLTGADPRLPPHGAQPVRAYDRSLSPVLEQFVVSCTERDPQRRPPDMRRFLQRIAPFCKERDARLFGREAFARLRGILSGENGETTYRWQKNICKIPRRGEPSAGNGVL